MSALDRYGRRKVSKMLAEWSALRDAIRGGDPAQAQATFDACEEWVDFAFAPRADTILSDPRVKALVEAVDAIDIFKGDMPCKAHCGNLGGYGYCTCGMEAKRNALTAALARMKEAGE